MFIGRHEELSELKKSVLKQKINAPKLIVCYGRRRIGKSRLIREFGDNLPKYIEIQGLAPAPKQNNQDQINHFLNEFCRQTNLPKITIDNWRDVFIFVSTQIKKNRCLLFLDEISWMGHNDPSFASILKVSWDTEFQNNQKLILVLCGSVSTWISKNILNSTSFMGRIDLDLLLKEMPLCDSNLFFSDKISNRDKFLFLCHSGGIPRYLKEFQSQIPLDAQLANLAFNANGLFFNDFERIFNDIFSKRTKTYLNIVLALKDGAITVTELAKKMKKKPSGKFVDYCKDLILAGFISSFEAHDLKNPLNKSKFIRYRLTDNYLRFYLKQILPHHNDIKKGVKKIDFISQIKGYEAFLGHQFENLILNNMPKLIEILQINSMDILYWGPHFQVKNTKQEACQVDILIQTKTSICIIELKSGLKISDSLKKEMESKIKKLKLPRRYGLRKVLIHATEDISESNQNYFDQIIALEDFF
jgi:AAA+ ATPase superfamily predicted ATPase